MPTVWGRKTGPDTLRIYGHHAPQLEAFHEGDRLRIVVDKDRNGKFNSLFHVMLSKVADAINRGPARTSIDDLKRFVKLRKGLYDVVTLPRPTPTGETTSVAFKSTSFAKMGEEEFHRFALDACELIRAELAPWVADSPEWPEIATILNSILPEDA